MQNISRIIPVFLCKRRILITLGIAFVFAVSFFLRIHQLGLHDLWYDEACSVFLSRSPLNEWNAPLYWIMLHFWIKIFDVYEFSLRFPSMLFSFLTTIIVYLIGKLIFDRKTAVLATIFISLSAFNLWYAQEARDYSQALFFGTLSSYFLCFAIKSGKNKLYLWILFILSSLCGIYTSYFYIPLIFAHFFYVAYVTRLRNKKMSLVFLVILAGAGFWFSRFISKFAAVREGFWVLSPDLESISITLQNYVLGYSGSHSLYILSFILTLGLFVMLFLLTRLRKEAIQDVSFCVFMLFIPITLLFLFSKLFFSVYLNRGLLLFSPYFYLLIAYILIKLYKNALIRITSYLLIFIFACGAILYHCDYMYPPLKYHMGTYLKKPVKPIINFLNSNYNDHYDAIAFSNQAVMPGIDYYGNRVLCMYYFFSPQILDSSWGRPVIESDIVIPVHKILNLKFKKVWVICSDWERSGNLDDNSLAVKQWLERNLRLVSSQEIEGTWIYCYARKDPV